jgi:5-methylcytosine-specific restriction endonuclease McrA
MKADPDDLTVRDVLNLKSQQMLVVNPEYQRGSVWTLSLKKKLVDSLLRGYPEHSEWRKHATHALRARKLGRKVGRREPILKVYARSRSAEVLYCHWCKGLTAMADRAVDHIVPLARGGDHTARNLCICCWSCNQAKSDQLPQDFLQVIKPIRKHNLAVRRRGLEKQLSLEFEALAPRRRKPLQKATQLTLVRLQA